MAENKTIDQLVEVTTLADTKNLIVGSNSTANRITWANIKTLLASVLQPLAAGLTSLAALATAADKIPYTTAEDVWAEADITAFGRSLIDDADAATALATLGAAASSHTHGLADVTDAGALAALDTVGTTEIDADSVTLTELEHGTQGDILYYGASGAPARLGAGTEDYVLTTKGAGANPEWAEAAAGGGSEWTYDTINTTTGGTTIDFTGLPAGITEVEMFILGISQSGADELTIKIGPSGGLVTTGYIGTVANFAGSAIVWSTFAKIATVNLAANPYRGRVQFQLIDPATDTWAITSQVIEGVSSADNENALGMGHLALSGSLALITLANDGAGTFDVNVGVQIRYR
jgi:hypothetical protein